jgi:hypothetical protein
MKSFSRGFRGTCSTRKRAAGRAAYKLIAFPHRVSMRLSPRGTPSPPNGGEIPTLDPQTQGSSVSPRSGSIEHVEPKTALLRMFQTWTKAFHWVSASPGAACLAPTCLVLSPLRLPAISHGHGRSVCGLSVSPSGAPGHFTRPGAATFSLAFSLTMLHEAPAKSRSVVGRNGCNDRCEHTGCQTP